MTRHAGYPAEIARPDGKSGGRASFAILLLAGWAVGISDRFRATSSIIDLDDSLRRLQVADLLADGDWFDRTLPMITSGGPYLSPWSRLVDAPYVLLTRLFDIFLPSGEALDLATRVWPPILLILLAWLVLGTVRALLGRAPKALELVAMLVLFSQAALEFAPGRIDHHNVQFVLLAGMARALTLDTPWKSGALIGALASLSVAVGLETAPLVAVALGGVALAGVFGKRPDTERLLAAGLLLVSTSLAGGLALLGPAGMMSVACDAFSLPFITALSGMGIIFATVPRAWAGTAFTGRNARALRLASLAIPGAALGLALILAFPACLAGPYAMVDDISRAYWLSHVPQEHSTLDLVWQSPQVGVAGLMAVAIFAVILSARQLAVWPSQRDGVPVVLWSIIACAMVLAIMQIRFVHMFFLLAALALPVAVAELATRKGNTQGWILAASAAAGMFVLAGLLPAGTTDMKGERVYAAMTSDACPDADFSVLAQQAPGEIIAPFGLGFAILDQQAGHTLAAIPFHRASPGIRRMATAFTSRDPAAVQTALTGAAYVVVCARNWSIPHADAPLFTDLTRQTPPPGLTLLTPGQTGDLLVYRVEPNAF